MRPSEVIGEEKSNGRITIYSNEDDEAYEYDLVGMEELGNEV